MILIEPRVETIAGDNLTRIFKASTTCYRSEDRTKKTPEEFAKMLIRRNHTAMLEHSMIVVRIPAQDKLLDVLILGMDAYTNKTGKPCFVTRTMEFDNKKVSAGLFAGNVRAWRDFLFYLNAYQFAIQGAWISFYRDPLFEDLSAVNGLMVQYDLSDYVQENMEGHILAPRFNIITAKFTCSEGVSLEMFRHRTLAADYEAFDLNDATAMSPAQESTRYVDYAGEMAFVKPWWWEDTTDARLDEKRKIFEEDCADTERRYRRRREMGMKPQDARGVLSKDLRTEIVLTGTIDAWLNWYDLRSAKAAHPDMRLCAEMFRSVAGTLFQTELMKRDNQ